MFFLDNRNSIVKSDYCTSSNLFRTFIFLRPGIQRYCFIPFHSRFVLSNGDFFFPSFLLLYFNGFPVSFGDKQEIPAIPSRAVRFSPFLSLFNGVFPHLIRGREYSSTPLEAAQWAVSWDGLTIKYLVSWRCSVTLQKMLPKCNNTLRGSAFVI